MQLNIRIRIWGPCELRVSFSANTIENTHFKSIRNPQEAEKREFYLMQTHREVNSEF